MRRRDVLVGILLAVPLAASAGSRSAAARPAAGTPPTLGLIPRTCPANPPSSPTSTIPVINGSRSRFTAGAYPVWGYGFTRTGGGHVTLDYGIEKPPHLDYFPGYGWSHKFSLIFADGFRGRVTLHGGELGGSAPLRFMGPGSSQGRSSATRVLVLDVAKLRALFTKPPHPFQIPSDIAVPHAGCYYLEAQWARGTWRLVFAAGAK